jgi:hypothetical protein
MPYSKNHDTLAIRNDSLKSLPPPFACFRQGKDTRGGETFSPFSNGEGVKKLGKPIRQKCLHSLTIAAFWKVEVASISKQRIGSKFFILSSLPEKVPL